MLRRSCFGRSLTMLLGLLVTVSFVHPSTARIGNAAGPIEAKSVLIKLIARVETPAQQSGVLVKLSVREGDHVSRGGELARMEDTEAQLAKEQARIEWEAAKEEAANESDVRIAEAAARFAAAVYDRAKQTVARIPTAIAKEELERMQFEQQKTSLEFEQAQHRHRLSQMAERLKKNALDIAAYRADRHVIRAPIDGIVVQLHHRQGEWLEPGEKVVRILRMDRLRAEGYVDLQDIDGDLRGRAVTLRVDLPGRPNTEFAGKVAFVNPEIDPVNSQVLVWAEIENPDLVLQPGLRARMTIAAKE